MQHAKGQRKPQSTAAAAIQGQQATGQASNPPGTPGLKYSRPAGAVLGSTTSPVDFSLPQSPAPTGVWQGESRDHSQPGCAALRQKRTCTLFLSPSLHGPLPLRSHPTPSAPPTPTCQLIDRVAGWVDEAQLVVHRAADHLVAHSRALVAVHVAAAAPQRRGLQQACVAVTRGGEAGMGWGSVGQEEAHGADREGKAKLQQFLPSAPCNLAHQRRHGSRPPCSGGPT